MGVAGALRVLALHGQAEAREPRTVPEACVPGRRYQMSKVSSPPRSPFRPSSALTVTEMARAAPVSSGVSRFDV